MKMLRCACVIGLVVQAFLGLSVSAEERLVYRLPQGDKGIVLVNCGAVATQEMEKIRDWIEGDLFVQTRVIDMPLDDKNTDLVTVGRMAAKLMTTNDICFVAVAAPKMATWEDLVVVPDQNWALVNLNALTFGKPTAEKLDWRVQRQIMRALGFLFGVGFSPDPHCVSKPLDTIGQLDEMGRNFSPPILARFHEEASQRGVKTIAIRHRRWMIEHGYLKPSITTNPVATPVEAGAAK